MVLCCCDGPPIISEGVTPEVKSSVELASGQNYLSGIVKQLICFQCFIRLGLADYGVRNLGLAPESYSLSPSSRWYVRMASMTVGSTSPAVTNPPRRSSVQPSRGMRPVLRPAWMAEE